jgi:hypothetical protein
MQATTTKKKKNANIIIKRHQQAKQRIRVSNISWWWCEDYKRAIIIQIPAVHELKAHNCWIMDGYAYHSILNVYIYI